MTEPLRHIPPRRAGSKPPRDSRHRRTHVHHRPPTALRLGKQRLQNRPRFISNLLPHHHEPTLAASPPRIDYQHALGHRRPVGSRSRTPGRRSDRAVVRLIPEQPAFTTASERGVWERLRDGLGRDDVLIANLRLTDEVKDHEADLVVLMPDIGIVVLEVKGGSVWYDGGWWIKRSGRDTVIRPVDQARTAKYALRQYVEKDPRWSRGRVAWAHGVVTPFSEFGDDFEVAELPRWALHDRAEQGILAERVR